MPTVSQLVAEKNDRINYEQIQELYPWLYRNDLDCIISPDSDGLLCGLLTSHYLGWKIRGFYDGKVMVADHRVSPRSCIFLDMEIFRSGVRSVGQHMLLYNRNSPPGSWSNFNDCFSINNFRGHDGLHDFRLKYPFGTVHFLMAVLHARKPVPIRDSAIAPLLFTDGTYHNLFRYTENSLNWLYYLRADEEGNPLYALFEKDRYTIHELMTGMNDFWRARDEISDVSGERGDRVAITMRGGDGTPYNLEPDDDLYRFKTAPKHRAERFIHMLQEATGWQYKPRDWTWGHWNLTRFTKGSFITDSTRLNGRNFTELIDRNPLSFAMTSGNNYEYTIENPDSFE